MKAFTLIELMVAIALVIVFAGSGVVYLNNFNIKQKLDKAEAEMRSMVKMSQNYAKIKQKPVGYNSEVFYVSLTKSASGNLESKVNGVGSTYFSSKISEIGVTFSIAPTTLYFWGGKGQLSIDNNTLTPTFFGPTETAKITISINQSVAETRTIIINSLGGVE